MLVTALPLPGTMSIVSPKTQPYLPYRLDRSRTYLREWLRSGDPSFESLSFLLMRAFDERFGKKSPEAGYGVITESQLAWKIIQFMTGGQVIFHLEPELVQAFLTSDVGEVTFADIKLPFDSFYLHFGAAHGLTINEGRARLEGVFVERHPRTGEVGFSLVGDLFEPKATWEESSDQSFTFLIRAEALTQSLDTAIDAEVDAAQKKLTADPDVELAELEPESRADIKEHWQRMGRLDEVKVANRETLKACLRLVANALLYITGYPDDVTDDWQDGTPQAFRDKVARLTGKEQARAISKARSSGFTRIRRVGSIFQRDETREAAAAGGGSGPSPHWRRAHWRRQHYGEANALVKVIWVRGARVLGATVRGAPYRVTGDAPPHA